MHVRPRRVDAAAPLHVQGAPRDQRHGRESRSGGVTGGEAIDHAGRPANEGLHDALGEHDAGQSGQRNGDRHRLASDEPDRCGDGERHHDHTDRTEAPRPSDAVVDLGEPP